MHLPALLVKAQCLVVAVAVSQRSAQCPSVMCLSVMSHVRGLYTSHYACNSFASCQLLDIQQAGAAIDKSLRVCRCATRCVLLCRTTAAKQGCVSAGGSAAAAAAAAAAGRNSAAAAAAAGKVSSMASMPLNTRQCALIYFCCLRSHSSCNPEVKYVTSVSTAFECILCCCS